MRSKRSIMFVWLAIFVLAAPRVAASLDDERNLFEWSSLAPVVVAGTSIEINRKYVEVRVIESLRGDLAPGDVLRIAVKQANRTRDRMVDPKKLRLQVDSDYLLLLEPNDRSGEPSYSLVRGVDGARELPLEGREAMLFALRTFIDIQSADSHNVWWDRFGQLVEDTNPLLVQTALEQFLRYRRGEPELVVSLVPLLDHPKVAIREDAATLIGQIVERNPEPNAIPDDAAVRAELVSRATRDDAVVVRVAATEALASWPPELVDEVLEEISRSDPDQQVRYAAELVRREHRQNGKKH